jgi:hypothetical protein
VVTITPAIAPDEATDRWHHALRLASETRMRLLEHCGEPNAANVRLDMPVTEDSSVAQGR